MDIGSPLGPRPYIEDQNARDAGDKLWLAMPSGVLTVGAEVRHGNAGWQATRGSFYRTARRLFDGYVYA